MKATTILITCALLGSAACVQATEKGFGDGTLPEFLQQYDLDENGVLDEEEIQAMKELRKQAREERRDEIDTDGDGVISDEEREAAREAMEAAIAAKRAEKFAEIAGEDGLLTLEEFSAIPALADADPERVAAMFARLDADDSGDVTLEEFNVRLRHHRHHRPHRPHRPRPGDGGGEGPGDGGGEGPGDGGGEGPGDGGGEGPAPE